MSDKDLNSARFPRSSRYHPGWVLAGVSGGANSLWLTEWLSEAMPLRPGMRVEIEALAADAGRYLGYLRVVGRRRFDADLDQPPPSLPVEYTKKPLLRGRTRQSREKRPITKTREHRGRGAPVDPTKQY